MSPLTRRLRIVGLLLSLMAVVTGCVGSPMIINTIPDQPVDYARGRTVLATACGFQLLLIIPIMTNERAERALQKLRREAGEYNYIADVKVRERWFYGLVGTMYCTELEGMAFPRQATTS